MNEFITEVKMVSDDDPKKRTILIHSHMLYAVIANEDFSTLKNKLMALVP